MRAAIFSGPGRPIEVGDVTVEAPRSHEVLVRLHYSGVCHSDYHVILGEWTMPTPMILGHEGAGVVEAVGDEVADVAVGDHVILSWTPNCRRCFYCTIGEPQLCEVASATAYAHGTMLDDTSRLSIRGGPVYSFLAVGSFAEYAVVPETGAIAIRPDMPLDKASLIGCGVMTGVGAVINTAKVNVGSTVLVIGCGGVGLSVLQGALLSSACRIIAADISDAKLEIASRMGATETINPSREDLMEAVRGATAGRGVDYAFEAIGLSRTIEQAYEAIRPGGTAVVVGQVPEGHRITIDPYVMSDREKTLTGCNYGSSRPSIDFPKLVDLYMNGKLQLDEMVSAHLPLERVEDAFSLMASGSVIRTVLELRTGAMPS